MPYISLKEEKIYYERGRNETGPALIPIHGSGCRGAHWPEAVRQLPEVQVFTPDLPGHGRSSGNGRSNMEEYAEFITLFVERLRLKQVVLTGHSIGGAIGMTAALKKPVWLSGLILVGTGAAFGSPGSS